MPPGTRRRGHGWWPSTKKRCGPWRSSCSSNARQEGLRPLDDPERTARVIEVLFRGIGLLRVMQPDVVDDEFLEVAIEFVAWGLGAGGGSPGSHL